MAVNRSIRSVDPALYVHGNCSVQMISPALYQKRLLRYELLLARRLRPYGIHHCGTIPTSLLTFTRRPTCVSGRGLGV